MSDAMTKLAHTAVEDLARCLYDVSPIIREIEGISRKVRFFELDPCHIQVLYDQASAAIVFMDKFQNMIESVAKAAVNTRLDELIEAQSGAGQNAANRLSDKLSVDVKIPDEPGDWNDVHQGQR